MNDRIKSISLDDIGELPNPLGMSASGEMTRNKVLQYSPDYSQGLDYSSTDMGPSRVEGTLSQVPLSESGTFMARFTKAMGPRPLSWINRPIIILGVLGLIVAAAGADYLMEEESVVNKLIAMILPADAPPPAPESKGPTEAELAAERAAAEAKAKLLPTGTPVEEIPGNPYWRLPNSVAGVTEMTPITAQQTDVWRTGLNLPFTYQRYKTVRDIRGSKTDGSAVILYEALAQPKFWTRMEALLGIADQGIAIDNESVKAAVGNARSDLVRNYFRRFRTDYSSGSAHMMRQALRIVDSNARMIIIQNLAHHRGDLNDLYLRAAVEEKDEKMKRYAQKILETHPLLPEVQAAYAKAMTEVPVLEATTTTKGKKAVEAPSDAEPKNAEVEDVYFVHEEEPVIEQKPKDPAEDIKKPDDGFNELNHSPEK